MADDAPLHLDIVLSFLAVFTVTIKLSAAMILLISLPPVAGLLRRKDFRRIAVTAILYKKCDSDRISGVPFSKT